MEPRKYRLDGTKPKDIIYEGDGAYGVMRKEMSRKVYDMAKKYGVEIPYHVYIDKKNSINDFKLSDKEREYAPKNPSLAPKIMTDNLRKYIDNLKPRLIELTTPLKRKDVKINFNDDEFKEPENVNPEELNDDGINLKPIKSNGKVHKATHHYGITLANKPMTYKGKKVSYEEALEHMKKCDKYYDKINEFREKQCKIYIENPKRVKEYIKEYEQAISSSYGSKEFKKQKLTKLNEKFKDLINEGFEYFGLTRDNKFIPPRSHRFLKPIDLDDDPEPDENLEIERFTTSNPLPKRNAEYFDNVIKDYMGIFSISRNELDKSIQTIKMYLGDRDKYTTAEVRDFVNRSKDITNIYVITVVRRLNKQSELNPLSDKERTTLQGLYNKFNIASIQSIGKNVKYKQNVLFHLLKKIGKKADMNDFYFQKTESIKKTDEEIKKVFNSLGWEFNPIPT